MDKLVCAQCGASFELAEDKEKKFPGWKPRLCLKCYVGAKRRPELNLTADEVLERFSDGPNSGVFTDGSCEHNPGGQGGWGVVKVINGTAVAEKWGHASTTTNQRMELIALIEAYKMLALDEGVTIYTDSQYAKKIAVNWAAAWKKNGWGRGKKQEPIKNLDLVQELYQLAESHPKVCVEWQKGHGGCRWNEYADSLSTAYTRPQA